MIRIFFSPVTVHILRALLVVSIPASLFLLYIWQNVNYASLNAKVRILNRQKEKLVKKNNELRIDVASSTSAERIENLYKKVYNYLPVPGGNRIITITLPTEKELQDKQKWN